jgi:hypothetical protein
MVEEIVSSFKENAVQKSKNPILGTYMIVWSIRNWNLMYSILNFDTDTKLKFKVDFISHYYSNVNLLFELGTNLFYSILILIVSFIVINLSRFIVNFFETTVTPWVYKISDKSSIVPKIDYEKQLLRNRDLITKLKELHNQKTDLEIKNIELRSELDKYLGASLLEKDIQANSKPLDGFEKSTVDVIKKNQLESILKTLDKKNLIDTYLKTSILIRKGEGVIDSLAVDEFIVLNLIKLDSRDSFNSKKCYYELTYLGDKVIESIKLV